MSDRFGNLWMLFGINSHFVYKLLLYIYSVGPWQTNRTAHVCVCDRIFTYDLVRVLLESCNLQEVHYGPITSEGAKMFRSRAPSMKAI